VPAQELQGVGCVEMPADWLRWALKTTETGEPHKASVVSLVPSEHPPIDQAAADAKPNEMGPWDYAKSGCPSHGWAYTAGCPDCNCASILHQERGARPAPAPEVS
jgi:hypothetical protein